MLRCLASLGKTRLSFKSICVLILGAVISHDSMFTLIFSPFINSNSYGGRDLMIFLIPSPRK